MNNNILVSISCITYNHENYIADAIEGFIMQKTDFKYEVLIHDDASTDKTPKIIKEYELKYPDLVKPIYQIENQHSKGKGVSRFNYVRAKGKYIALCEGDDFWINPYKLQKQVDYMEKHPECSMCVHAAYVVDADTGKKIAEVRPSCGNRIFSVEEIIKGGGSMFATNSVIYPKKFIYNRPNFFRTSPVGDRPLFIHLALNGKVFYFDDYMSVYRKGVKGSWTDRVFENINMRILHFNKIEKMLDEVDEYTNHKYHNTIAWTKKKGNFDILLAQGKYKEARTGIYKEYYDKLSLKVKIILYMKYYFPNITNILIWFKRKLKYG